MKRYWLQMRSAAAQRARAANRWVVVRLRRWLLVERDLVAVNMGRESDLRVIGEAFDDLSALTVTTGDTLANVSQRVLTDHKRLVYMCEHADSLKTTNQRYLRSIQPQ